MARRLSTGNRAGHSFFDGGLRGFIPNLTLTGTVGSIKWRIIDDR